MSPTSPLSVRFWGVRGSISCPGETHQRYGGNTSCLEVRCGDRLIVFDAGTGLRPLGEELSREAPLDTDLFLTHTHHDHIAGLPFFAPLFDAANTVRLWAGHLKPHNGLHSVLCQFMTAPLFPVPPQIFTAKITYGDFTAGETLQVTPEIRLITAPLNHPNGATGYRLEYADKSLCYVTDTEHVAGHPDQNILALIAGADMVIYDSSYCDEEFEKYVGWGHSTWQEGVRLCDAAGVGQLVIFHHDPSHDDRFMDRVAEAAEKARPGTTVAREGMVLHP